MLTSHYKVEGPAMINVSGGRTSGFMLAKILEAHGGTLPDDVVPVFLNTGLEHERTYEFVRDMESEWSVPILWLELTKQTDTDGPRFGWRQVDFCSASRKGEPFSIVNAEKGMLPNPVARFCTSELKVRTANRWAADYGWSEWSSVIGLRADEQRRAARIKGDIARENIVLPMYEAGHTKEDVLAFWKEQHFDLQLPNNDNAFGNCVGCFLKTPHKLAKIMRSRPDYFDWWIDQEESSSCRFRRDRPTYRQMLHQVTVQGQMFDDTIDDDAVPCTCTD